MRMMQTRGHRLGPLAGVNVKLRVVQSPVVPVTPKQTTATPTVSTASISIKVMRSPLKRRDKVVQIAMAIDTDTITTTTDIMIVLIALIIPTIIIDIDHAHAHREENNI